MEEVLEKHDGGFESVLLNHFQSYDFSFRGPPWRVDDASKRGVLFDAEARKGLVP